MNTINNILEAIEKQAKCFLEDTISIEIINIQESSNIYENTVSIDLSDTNINFNVILSVDDMLLQQILLQLLKEDIDDIQKEEIFKS